MKRSSLALVTLVGCVQINGKHYGLGGGSVAAAPASSSAPAPAPSGDDEYRPDNGEAYANAPADPWAAVSGDGPTRLDAKAAGHITMRDEPLDCTAAHDHCLPRLTWFIEAGYERERDPVHRVVAPYLFGPKDPETPWNARNGHHVDLGQGYIAYRTVPATRKNLKKGVLVASMTYPYPHAGTNGVEAWQAFWHFGVVDRIDWDHGKLYYAGLTDPHWISSARVAVLSWKPGGKVEILNGASRDGLAVAVADVVLPKEPPASIADPWSQVGADKQPKIDPDDVPIEETSSVVCDPAHDHCLRPWVWFVQTPTYPDNAFPGRYAKGGFVYASDGKHLIDGARVAYRTVPATSANLKVGAIVVVYPSSVPGDEYDALEDKWFLGTVADFNADAGLVKIKDDDRNFGLARVRVAVVKWVPDGKAEKLP